MNNPGTPRVDVLANHNRRSLTDAIQCLAARWPDICATTTSERPVFVLAAGWRSGSTLLQRMLMPECFIWGEPYGHSGMLQSLADPLRCITEDWPEPHFFYHGERASNVAVTLRRDEPAASDVAALVDAAMRQEFEAEGRSAEVEQEVDRALRDGGETAGLITTERDGYIGERDRDITERFVANLYPSVATLLDAHRAYLETLFVQPARDAKAQRWGFKEVRLSADYAHYLKLLYPALIGPLRKMLATRPS
ncbi:MAG: hypothetical protein O3C40_10910 [Planctomycetota bacterium]|nr:hypothetical protein [Planctomycetota bacterium]